MAESAPATPVSSSSVNFGTAMTKLFRKSLGYSISENLMNSWDSMLSVSVLFHSVSLSFHENYSS